MKGSSLHYQQCEQPSLLPVPEITFGDSGLSIATTPFESVINSALSADPTSDIIGIIFVLAGMLYLLRLLKPPATWILFGFPVMSAVLIVSALFGIKWITPYSVHFSVKNNFHTETISALNLLSQGFDQISRIERMPKLAADTIAQKEEMLRQFSSYVLAHGIKRNVATGRINAALELAAIDIFGETSASDKYFRSAAYWEASRIELQGNNTSSALEHAEAAYHYDSNRKTEILVQTAISAKITSLATSNEFDQSLTLLHRLRADWNPEKQKNIIEYIARYRFIKALENDAVYTQGTTADLIGAYKNLVLRLDIITLQERTSTILSCDLAGLYNISGTASINAGETDKSITEFLSAEALLKDGPYTKQMLPVAYTANGHAKLAAGDNIESLNSFKSAYEREGTKERGCNVSLALNAVAVDQADNRDYKKAFESLQTADSYCKELEQTKFTRAALHLSQGEYAMGNGLFSKADSHFQLASAHASLKDIARNHRNSIPYLSDIYKKLNEIRGVGKFPKLNGVICSTGDIFCENILLIKDNESYGVANYAFNEMYFDDDRQAGSYVIITDSDNDSYFEQWTYASKYAENVYFDLDYDYRPDWLTRYSEGTQVEERALSGIVSVRFSAAINNAADAFSEPDTYLVVKKNGYLIGRSHTVNNNTYPSFQNSFVINYKFRDRVSIAVHDKDIFFDDLIDTTDLEDLPETGYLSTKRKRVALAMKVIPSDQPEGVYIHADDKGNINPFEAPSWLNESSDIAEIVKNSRKEQSRAIFMAMVGSFVAPEIVLSIAVRPITFFNVFIIGVGGHMATHELLTYRQP